MPRKTRWAATDKRPVAERRKEHAADPNKYADGFDTLAAQQGRSLVHRDGVEITLPRVGFLERGKA